jgi:hypothetical protein
MNNLAGSVPVQMCIYRDSKGKGKQPAELTSVAPRFSMTAILLPAAKVKGGASV